MYANLRLQKPKPLCLILLGTLTFILLAVIYDESSTLRLWSGDPSNIKILCWIPTIPVDRLYNTSFVLKTWGQHCDKFMFISSENDNSSETVIALPGGDELGAYSWNRSILGWKYLHENYIDEADWFLKTDSQTYIVVENVRNMVRLFSPSEPIFFGFNYGLYLSDGMMDKSTQLLSKDGLRRFIEVGLHDRSCNKDFDSEQAVGMAQCLKSSNIKVEDSRDNLRRERYLKLQNKVETYNIELVTGFEGVSDLVVAIENTNLARMYVLEYLVYYLRPARI